MIAPSSMLKEFVERALAEDIGRGDVTTQALFADDVPAEGRIATKTPTVMAGGPVAALVFQTLDPTAWVTLDEEEGKPVEAGAALLTVQGDGRAILTGERVALNILQRLCAGSPRGPGDSSTPSAGFRVGSPTRGRRRLDGDCWINTRSGAAAVRITDSVSTTGS